MPNVIYTATLDFTDNGVFNAGWRIKQGDFGSSSLNITLSDNGAIVFDDSIEPEIVFKRADGRSVISTMQSAGENSGYYIYNFVGNELAVPGPCVVDVKIVGSDSRTSTASCRFDVIEDTIGYDETGAETYNNPVASLIDIALTKSGEAEAYAIGTKNGRPVGPEDPAFEDNSKYYFDEIFEILPKVEDDEPYALRKGLGNKVSFNLEGASVAWNQLVQNGNFASTSNWSTTRANVSASGNELTVQGTATNGFAYQSLPLTANHKYLISVDAKGSEASNNNLLFIVYLGTWENYYSVSAQSTSYKNYSTIISTVSDSNDIYEIRLRSYNSSFTNKFKNINVIDLTLLFGKTIADAIYAMEQANSGSGVAFFRKYFPKPYYAYDIGSIQSVCVSGRKIVGKNKCSGIENGSWTTSTQSKSNVTNRARVENTVAVKPLTSYTINAKALSGKTIQFITQYYSGLGGGTFISESSWSAIPFTFTTPSNCECLTFIFRTSANDNNPESYVEEVQLEEGSTATPYEPYTETTYPIPTEQLRGLFTLKDGKLKANGDIFESSGEYTWKYGIVNLGDLSWTLGGTNRFDSSDASVKNNIKAPASTSDVANIICEKYVPLSVDGRTDKSISVYTNGNLIVQDSAYSDVVTFKAAMAGIYLVYERNVPIELDYTSFQMPQKAYADGTEEFINGLTRDVMVPVGNNSEYFVDDVVNYSTSEQDTGMKWLNGKKIYQKTLDLGSSGISVPANGTAATSESKTGKEQVIWSSAITTDGKTAPYIGGFVGSTYITMENKTGNATTVRYFTFQYTKS